MSNIKRWIITIKFVPITRDKTITNIVPAIGMLAAAPDEPWPSEKSENAVNNHKTESIPQIHQNPALTLL